MYWGTPFSKRAMDSPYSEPARPASTLMRLLNALTGTAVPFTGTSERPDEPIAMEPIACNTSGRVMVCNNWPAAGEPPPAGIGADAAAGGATTGAARGTAGVLDAARGGADG